MKRQGVGVRTEARAERIARTLANLELRRKSYSLQLFKQFLLFPDES